MSFVVASVGLGPFVTVPLINCRHRSGRELSQQGSSYSNTLSARSTKPAGIAIAMPTSAFEMAFEVAVEIHREDCRGLSLLTQRFNDRARRLRLPSGSPATAAPASRVGCFEYARVRRFGPQMKLRQCRWARRTRAVLRPEGLQARFGAEHRPEGLNVWLALWMLRRDALRRPPVAKVMMAKSCDERCLFRVGETLHVRGVSASFCFTPKTGSIAASRWPTRSARSGPQRGVLYSIEFARREVEAASCEPRRLRRTCG